MKKRTAYKIVRNYIREEQLEWLPIEEALTEVKMRFTRIPCTRYTKGQVETAKIKIRKYCRRRVKARRVKKRTFNIGFYIGF